MSSEDRDEDMIAFRKELDAHRKQMVNYKSEIATMYESGSVVIMDKGALANGQPTIVTRYINPTDPDYIDFCKSFNLNKPGDSYFKTYKKVGSDWVLESEGKNKS